MMNDELLCICAECKQSFALTAETEVKGESTFIQMAACESGGIYSVVIKCPHCDHEHSLM